MADKQETIDKLSQLLVDTVTKVEGGIEKGIDFAQQQMPDVIHQLLVWNMVQSLICWIFGLFLEGVSLFFWSQAFKFRALHDTDRTKYRNYDDKAFSRGFIGIILQAPAIMLIVLNWDWLQIWLAPKVWLIEYVSHLVRH